MPRMPIWMVQTQAELRPEKAFKKPLASLKQESLLPKATTKSKDTTHDFTVRIRLPKVTGLIQGHNTKDPT